MTNAALPTGLIPVWDERSRGYPIRELLTAAPRQDKDWPLSIYLDQLQEGACVGFTGAEEAAAEPVVVRGVNDALGRRIYAEAQKIDPWANTPHEGTTMIAGATVMMTLGFWTEYRWAFGIDDVIDTLVQFGPVAFAGPWYPPMFNPTAEGQLVMDGQATAGHAITGRKLDWARGRVWIRNHWLRKPDGNGSFWGVNGEAFFPIETLDKWLKSGGQCMVPVTRGDPSAPPPIPPEPPHEETLNERIIREMGPIDHIDMDIVFAKGAHWPWRGNAP